MELKKIEGAIEAILFAMGDAVSLRDIAKTIGHDMETTKKIIRNMMLKYQTEDRGIKIIELEDSFQMCSKEEYYDYLVAMALQPKKAVLSDVMLETLSIIAYKQPVTKLEIEKIRGVKSDHAVNKLVEYGLVREVGRLDAPGRPILFGTTEEFLRNFGVQGLDDLPEMPDLGGEGQMRISENGEIVDPAELAEITGADTPETAGPAAEETGEPELP